jgi:hypothetical protein
VIDLDFAVAGVEIDRFSASPLLLFALRLTNPTPAVPVENVMLRAQIRIEARQRPYGPREQERLGELFGAAADWDRTLRSLLWTHASASVPAFAEECTVLLPVPCSYDFHIAATKYFYGLESGEVPLLLLFSGTVFWRNSAGALQIGQIAHHKEASYHLPVRIWQAMMDHYYPDSVWLRVSRDLFEKLYRHKRRSGLASWEQTLESLLDMSHEEAQS